MDRSIFDEMPDSDEMITMLTEEISRDLTAVEAAKLVLSTAASRFDGTHSPISLMTEEMVKMLDSILKENTRLRSELNNIKRMKILTDIRRNSEITTELTEVVEGAARIKERVHQWVDR